MTGPSSTPRGEHTPRPGATWDTRVVWDEEHVIPNDELLPAPGAAWTTSTTRAEQAEADDAPAPIPNRATRRALARAARRKKHA